MSPVSVMCLDLLAGAVKKKLRAAAADAEKPAGEAKASEVILDEEQLGHLVKGTVSTGSSRQARSPGCAGTKGSPSGGPN